MTETIMTVQEFKEKLQSDLPNLLIDIELGGETFILRARTATTPVIVGIVPVKVSNMGKLYDDILKDIVESMRKAGAVVMTK